MPKTDKTKQEAMIQIGVTIGLTLFTVVGGMVFYHLVEKLSWVDAWYFVMITLTTVGYGDISPQTELGRVVTPVFIIIGIGLITSLITGVNKMVVRRRTERKEARLQQTKRKN